eukprot:7511232-Ditylum_brightwellii.AAC.1
MHVRDGKGCEEADLGLGDDCGIDISLSPGALFQVAKNNNVFLCMNRVAKLILFDVEDTHGGNGFGSTFVTKP